MPVLVLTRRGDLKSKLAAFDQPVDDIMVIPFSPEELLARVLQWRGGRMVACLS